MTVKRREWKRKKSSSRLQQKISRKHRKRESKARRLRRFNRDKRGMEKILGGIAWDLHKEAEEEEKRLMKVEMVNHPFDLSRGSKRTVGELYKAARVWSKYEGRLSECGVFIHVNKCSCCQFGDRFTGFQECGVKTCPYAQQKKSQKQFHKVKGLMGLMKEPRFMTLSIKHGAGDRLADLLKKIVDSFNKLKRRVDFKRRVRGGLITLEISWHPSNGWHPHIHCIYDGDFFPQRELSELWFKVTKDSNIVDVRAVDEKAISETSKYLAKPSTFIYEHEKKRVGKGWKYEIVRDENGELVKRPFEIQKCLVREFIEATRNFRTLRPFGYLHGAKVEEEIEEETLSVCPSCGAIDTMELVRMSFEEALALYEGQEELELKVRGPPRRRAA